MSDREKGSAILGIVVVIMMVIDCFVVNYNVQLEIGIILGCITLTLLDATDVNSKGNSWLTWLINGVIWLGILIMTLNG